MLRIPPSTYRMSAFSVLHLLFMASPEKHSNKKIETGGNRRKKYYITPWMCHFRHRNTCVPGNTPPGNLTVYPAEIFTYYHVQNSLNLIEIQLGTIFAI